MIVISAPRCGGTKFTFDLSQKHNLIFVGETKSIYLRDYLRFEPTKPHLHEIKNQPMFDSELWLDTIKNPHKYAILANQRDISMLLPQADYLLLRKNFNNIIGSYLKWLEWTEQFYGITMDVGAKKGEIWHIIHNIYSICLWSRHTGKPITWYEDHYTTPDYELSPQLCEYVSLIDRTNLEELFVQCGGLKPSRR